MNDKMIETPVITETYDWDKSVTERLAKIRESLRKIDGLMEKLRELD